MPAHQLQVGSETIVLRATSADTNGALLALEVRMPPGGGPPLLHRHAPEELYRVEAGELTFYVEDGAGAVRRTVAGAGDVVHLPGGRTHTVRNESEAEARAYVVFSPGAPMEAFVRAAAGLPAEGSPSPGEVLALAERHGITMAGPPPAP